MWESDAQHDATRHTPSGRQVASVHRQVAQLADK